MRVIICLGETARVAVEALELQPDQVAVSMYHPAYVLRNRKLLAEWQEMLTALLYGAHTVGVGVATSSRS